VAGVNEEDTVDDEGPTWRPEVGLNSLLSVEVKSEVTGDIDSPPTAAAEPTVVAEAEAEVSVLMVLVPEDGDPFP
jgi:hypothetical protein